MIKEVKVIPWCISCRNCENVCPSVFKVNPKSKVITDKYEWKESEILQAEAMCPVNVIKVKQAAGSVKISFKDATLVEKNYLTPDTLELKFNTKNFKFKPGQYISLQGNDSLWNFSRSYSVAKWDDEHFTLNVKLEKKWRGSTFLKNLKIWKSIKFLWAIWAFYLQNNNKAKVLIATWTWLAPMVAMLDQIDKNVQKTVIFWVRYEKDVYYKELLESYPNTKVIIKVSRPEEKTIYSKWRVTDEVKNISKESEVYICWNPEMVEHVREWLAKNWHDEKLIFNESFTISRKYPWKCKDIFLNWNIPHLNKLSWAVIIFSLTLIPFSWVYNKINNNLYWDFLFINNYMGFMYDLSWWSVVFVMAIRPLADLFPKIGILSKLVTLRKAFWILSASIIVSNFVWSSIFNINKFLTYFTLAWWALYMPLITKLSEISALILLLTSNKLSQKTLWTYWKKIQRLSYIYFITWWIVAWLYFPMKVYPLMAIVIILWFAALIKSLIKKD